MSEKESSGASGSRKFMLTAEGFWPVAPVGGRSEEERLFAFSLSLVPVERPCSEPFFGTIHTQADYAEWR